MSAVTEKLAYLDKPSSVDSKHYEHCVLPSNGTTFNPSEIIRLDIPCSGYGDYLDGANSYLKLTFNNLSKTSANADAVVHLDGSAYSLIDRQQVLYAGYTLEDISDLGQLASLWLDNMMSVEARQTYASITYGTKKHGVSHISSPNASRHGAEVGAGGSITMYIPMFGMLGVNSDKYLPLGAMTASDSLRLELTLAGIGVPLRTTNSTDTGNFSITGVEFVAHMVKLSDDAESMVRRSVGNGKYRIHGDSFRSFNSTLQNGANNSTIHIPVKVSSLKTIFIAHRMTSSIQAKNKHSITNRSKADMSEYYFTVGSTRLPQKPVKCNAVDCAEVQVQLQKAFHSFGKKQHNISYYKEAFVKTGANDDDGAFLVGMDFESFSGKSTVINQGISTISQNIFFNGTYATVPGDCLVTSFAHFDQILEIDTNTGLAKVMF